MNVKRITRLLSLLQTLQSGQGSNADGLAEACGVSRRTVFRDIESLREAGVPVAFENESQRYRIDSAHFLPPTNLTIEESLALLVVLGQTQEGAAGPFADSARGAAAKVEASLPAAMRDELRDLASAVTIRPASSNPLSDKEAIYHTLLAASVERREVQIEYDCLTDFERIETDLQPYTLLFHRRSWYAIGRSSRHDSVRTFNVGRITRADPREETFRLPRSFSVSKHLGNAWGLIPEPGPDQVVHLRFTQLVARNVAEVLWHPTQRCEFADDGSLDYYVTVSGLTEIVWWILGYGDQVEVIKPARLRRMVSQRLRLAASRYPDEP